MPVYPAARTQGAMQAALNSLRQSSQDQTLRFNYFNAENALDLAKRQQAMEATHTLRADKAARKASAGGGKKGTGGWGAIAGLAAGALLGPAGMLLPSMSLGASIGGAVDTATSRGGGGGGQQIQSGISNALDIYTEMQQFQVPAVQPYMSGQPEVFAMGLR